MTTVDFYLLGDAAADARERTACRLADKAFRLGHQVYLFTGDAVSTTRLDQLLWTFSAGSFIPHQAGARTVDAGLPVYVGHDEPALELADVLISIADEVPTFFSRFTRVAEIVGSDEQAKEQGRQRYRFYRDRGYPLNTHNL
jgi:DNA polymerase-3 subunit chi